MDREKITKDLLFPPYSEQTAAQFPTRKDVPLLDVPYYLYQIACTRLISDWLAGRIGVGAPTENWERNLIEAVNDLTVQCLKKEAIDQSETERDDQEASISKLYNELSKRKAQSHLCIATSHRRWIRMSEEFCRMTGVGFSGNMEELIRKHDLSKYTSEEVLGYAVMFGDGQVNWKQLEKEEKAEWDLALEHHYIHNPHHPEYFYAKQADGQREKFPIVEKVKAGRLFLEESVIDMMAARGERILKDDPTISIGKWMDIDEKYLSRYSTDDKKYVMELLSKWTKLGEDFVSDTNNTDKLKALFGRPVEL